MYMVCLLILNYQWILVNIKLNAFLPVKENLLELSNSNTIKQYYMVEYLGSFLDAKNPWQLNLSRKSIQSHCSSIIKVSF